MIPIETAVNLKSSNSFALNAVAQRLVRINNPADVELLKRYLAAEPQPCFVLGSGTNLVLTQDINNLLIKMQTKGKALWQESAEARVIEVQAGESWHDVVAWTVAQGWGGLENLALIPSSVGAAPIQNIGAYGVELQDVLQSVLVLDLTTGEQRRFNREECQFGYRDSIFKRNITKLAAGVIAVRYLILSLRLSLAKNWQPKTHYADLNNKLQQKGIKWVRPQDVFELICQIRREKLPDPSQLGNVGSFFKNPLINITQLKQLQQNYPKLVFYPLEDDSVKLSAGWMIEACGLKGKQQGGAAVYTKQALVLCNVAAATGADVLILAKLIQQKVFEQFMVKLEIEPLVI